MVLKDLYTSTARSFTTVLLVKHSFIQVRAKGRGQDSHWVLKDLQASGYCNLKCIGKSYEDIYFNRKIIQKSSVSQAQFYFNTYIASWGEQTDICFLKSYTPPQKDHLQQYCLSNTVLSKLNIASWSELKRWFRAWG